jgi:hypothetical protein
MKPIRTVPLAEHPDALLLQLVLDGVTQPGPRKTSPRLLASLQAITLEGLIAKAEHALADWRRTPPAHRADRTDEALSICLEQAIATLQGLPVAPRIKRVGIPFDLRAAARARKELGQ